MARQCGVGGAGRAGERARRHPRPGRGGREREDGPRRRRRRSGCAGRVHGFGRLHIDAGAGRPLQGRARARVPTHRGDAQSRARGDSGHLSPEGVQRAAARAGRGDHHGEQGRVGGCDDGGGARSSRRRLEARARRRGRRGLRVARRVSPPSCSFPPGVHLARRPRQRGRRRRRPLRLRGIQGAGHGGPSRQIRLRARRHRHPQRAPWIWDWC